MLLAYSKPKRTGDKLKKSHKSMYLWKNHNLISDLSINVIHLKMKELSPTLQHKILNFRDIKI